MANGNDRLPPAQRARAQELARQRTQEALKNLRQRQRGGGQRGLALPTKEFEERLKTIPQEEQAKAFEEVRGEFESQQRIERVKQFFRGILGGEEPSQLDEQALNRGENMMRKKAEAEVGVANWKRLNPDDETA